MSCCKNSAIKWGRSKMKDSVGIGNGRRLNDGAHRLFVKFLIAARLYDFRPINQAAVRLKTDTNKHPNVESLRRQRRFQIVINSGADECAVLVADTRGALFERLLSRPQSLFPRFLRGGNTRIIRSLLRLRSSGSFSTLGSAFGFSSFFGFGFGFSGFGFSLGFSFGFSFGFSLGFSFGFSSFFGFGFSLVRTISALSGGATGSTIFGGGGGGGGGSGGRGRSIRVTCICNGGGGEKLMRPEYATEENDNAKISPA